MNEYEQFLSWSSAKALELSAHPQAERAFLRDMRLLNADLIEVIEAVKEIGSGNLLTFWKRARRYVHLVPDPLYDVRYGMRSIRQRYGEVGVVRPVTEE